MERIRRGYELKGLFFGRPIRPFHLAVTIATFVIAVSNITTMETTVLGHSVSHLLGFLALMSGVLLSFGWWWRNEWAAEWGLLLATGVWISRGIYIALTDENLYVLGTIGSVILSFAWAIGAGGAYLLERYDHMVGGDLE
jgi:hypothetical protein